jgi:transposase
LQKQQVIDRLLEENTRLKARLRYQERTAKEGPFGLGTPSAKIPFKPNSAPEAQQRQGGAKPGHQGRGRSCPPPEQVSRRQTVTAPRRCPNCGALLRPKGWKQRTVIDVHPVVKAVVVYELEQRDCPGCHRVFTAQAPGVFSRGLLGNRLLAHVAIEHYVHGLTMGHLSARLGLGTGTLWAAMHALARRLEPVDERLVRDYRQALVKHADETGWRQDGHNGYAWLFCSERTSLFRFRQTRSGQVAQAVLGERPLPGTLVVDRYAGYNHSPCALQYCYAHLDRELKALVEESPPAPEVQRFAGVMRPLLKQAMQLRQQKLALPAFRQRAAQIKAQLEQAVHAPAQDPGIQRIQNVFREHADRLYHWAKHPDIPAENNRAERELRSLVIARKISFGSQSEQGLHTREVLMSVLHTLRKRTADVFAAFVRALNGLAEHESRDPYSLLFDSS